jgi:8-oxo-dGTP pyrophosphatase MutT (NUDIX family)
MPKPSDKKRRRSSRALTPRAGAAPRLQVGALCYRSGAKGALKVLLITSRDTGRWVIPKGWPMRNRTDPDAAAREAFEEAGVKGQISPISVGLYRYLKDGVPCVVRVYAMAVTEAVDDFPEAGQRRTLWASPEKAARQVHEPELAAIIRAFTPPADPGELPEK